MALHLIPTLLRSPGAISAGAPRVKYWTRALIGNRDVVGWGCNGRYNYFDLESHPYPAIRWRENSQELNALREKERGDWRVLTWDEKRELYRASFRQSFVEILTPKPGGWKTILAATLFAFDLMLLCYLWLDHYAFVWNPVAKVSDEVMATMAARAITEHRGPIFGLASCWDYDKNEWKPGEKPSYLKNLNVEQYLKLKKRAD